VALGLDALAIADRDGVYGLPRAHKAAQGRLHLICGAALTLCNSQGWCCSRRTRTGWTHLCRLITQQPAVGTPRIPAGHDPDVPLPIEQTDAVKGRGRLALDAVLDRAEGLDAIAVGDWPVDAAARPARGLRRPRVPGRLPPPGQRRRIAASPPPAQGPCATACPCSPPPTC